MIAPKSAEWKTAPAMRARIAGAFYLMSVASAIFAEAFVRGRLLYAVGLIPIFCFVAVTVLLYGLFKPISQTLALLAAFSNLVGLAFEAAEWQPSGINFALLLHGIYCLLLGVLLFRAAFLPRALSLLTAVAGLAWLLLALPGTHGAHPSMKLVGFIGEGSLMLWLLVMGIRAQKWIQQATGTRGTGNS